MAFVKGDRIEVEISHLRSYRPAIIVGKLDYASPSSYVVQYENSITDVVAAEDVRRSPPWIPATRYAVNDRVDAFDGGVWRSGIITRKEEWSSDYYVYLESCGVEICYGLSYLRVHLDRVDNGYWVLSSPAGQIMGSR